MFDKLSTYTRTVEQPYSQTLIPYTTPRSPPFRSRKSLYFKVPNTSCYTLQPFLGSLFHFHVVRIFLIQYISKSNSNRAHAHTRWRRQIATKEFYKLLIEWKKLYIVVTSASKVAWFAAQTKHTILRNRWSLPYLPSCKSRRSHFHQLTVGSPTIPLT